MSIQAIIRMVQIRQTFMEFCNLQNLLLLTLGLLIAQRAQQLIVRLFFTYIFGLYPIHMGVLQIETLR